MSYWRLLLRVGNTNQEFISNICAPRHSVKNLSQTVPSVLHRRVFRGKSINLPRTQCLRRLINGPSILVSEFNFKRSRRSYMGGKDHVLFQRYKSIGGRRSLCTIPGLHKERISSRNVTTPLLRLGRFVADSNALRRA